ncbi:hypothetical protein [Spirosoma aureum]|nr:hypothetical protein [Spirosoma aureum]
MIFLRLFTENKPFAFSAEYDEQLILLVMHDELEDVVVYQA